MLNEKASPQYAP